MPVQIASGTCAAAAAASTSNIQTTSARLNWSAVPGAVEYEIRGKKTGTSAAVSLYVNGNTTQKNVYGLLPATAYEWAVRAVCTPSGMSAFTALNLFTTLSGTRLGNGLSENNNPNQPNNIEQHKYTIYPNPAENTVTIIFTTPEPEPVTLKLYDMSGKETPLSIGQPNTKGEQTIDVSQLTNGIYQIAIQGIGWRQIEKLVIIK